MTNKSVGVDSLKKAIEELKDSQYYLSNRKFQKAEEKLARTIKYIKKTLAFIQLMKSLPSLTPCDPFGLIPIIPNDELNTPAGAIDLVQGQVVKLPSGTVISWISNTIRVCEPFGDDVTYKCCSQKDYWQIAGRQAILIDGDFNRQPLKRNPDSTGAYIPLHEGSKLIVNSDSNGESISRVKLILPETSLNRQTLEGFDPAKVEVYAHGPGCVKMNMGTTLASFITRGASL